jgi:hypothetical protein
MSGIVRPEAHNQLARMAETLEADGHTQLAAQYQARADRAQKAFSHLRMLGDEARRQVVIHTPAPVRGDGPNPEINRPEINRSGIGLDVADWLIRQGWTPPEFIGVDQ